MLDEFGFPEQTERKQRGKPGWPPHVLIGTRVHYRRAAVEQWLIDQEHRASEVRDA